jgi:hypothetical protein
MGSLGIFHRLDTCQQTVVGKQQVVLDPVAPETAETKQGANRTLPVRSKLGG